MGARLHRKPKIMVVDDSPIVCETVSMILEDRGYDVVTVDNVFSFAQALSTHKPDLVLIDVMMPAMKGDKLVEIAQRHDSEACPMVLFSDQSVHDLERLAAECGAAGYIQKTSNSDLLALCVASYLAKSGK
jgi:DNA-binding NtrC family response regulator